jgi:hypothetical protein
MEYLIKLTKGTVKVKIALVLRLGSPACQAAAIVFINHGDDMSQPFGTAV